MVVVAPEALKCPFLLEDEEQKLVVVLCNYLSLGQFELGRTALRQLYGLSPDRALHILKSLVLAGHPSAWLRSISVPSTAHFTWLCYTELKVLADSQDEERANRVMLPPWVLSCVELELLLSCIICKDSVIPMVDEGLPKRPLTNSVLSDIRTYGHGIVKAETRADVHNVSSHPSPLLLGDLQKDSSSIPSELSNEALAELKQVFIRFPLLGHALSQRLTSSSLSRLRTTERIQGLYIDIVRDYLFQKEYEYAYFFLHMLNMTVDMEPNSLNNLFTLLLSLCSEVFPDERDPRKLAKMGKRGDMLGADLRRIVNDRTSLEPVMNKYRIYEALLVMNNGYALGQYCAMEDSHVRRQSEHSRLPAPYKILYERGAGRADITDEQNLTDFWREFFTYMRVSDLHCLDFILSRSLEFIKEGAFDDASQLLAPFKPLKPLLVLLSWDHFHGDIRSHQKLMDSLWKCMLEEGASGDPQINQMCNQLGYRLSLTWWYAERYVSIGEKQGQNHTLINVADDVLIALRNYSILHVMRSRLPNLDSTDTLDIVRSRPAETKKILREKELDLAILHGYYSTKEVVNMFHQSALGSIRQENMQACLAEVKQYLTAVNTANFHVINAHQIRVGLLENIFSLLFLEKGQWKDLTPQLDPRLEGELASSTIKNVAAIGPNVANISSLFPFAYTFSVVPPYVLGHRMWHRSPFISDRALTRALLDLINECLLDFTFDKHKETASIKLSQGLRAQLRWHVERLQKYVREADWRLEVMDPLESQLRCLRPDSDFMPRMLASPDTLLSLCMKMNDYERCKDIIRFFALSSTHAAMVTLAEQLDVIKDVLHTGQSKVDLDHILCPLPDAHAFRISTDLAITMARLPLHCSELLEMSSSYQYRAPTSSTPSDAWFSNLVHRLQHLASTFPKQSLRSLLSNAETLPTDSKVLGMHLTRRQAKLDALSSLNKMLGLLQKGESHALDEFLHQLLNTFLDEPRSSTGVGASASTIARERSGSSGVIGEDGKSGATGMKTLRGHGGISTDDSQYLARFLQFVLDMGNILRDSMDDKHYNHVSNLEEGAKRHVAHLVFSKQLYTKAERLSELIDGDLVGILLRSCQCDTRQSPGVEQAACAPSESNKHTGLSFPLNMNVIQFLRPFSDMMAALACVLRSPPGVLNGVFLDYAMANTAPWPTLHRWVCMRAHAYAHFITVFIKQDIVEETKDGSSNSAGKQVDSSTAVKETFSPSFMDSLEDNTNWADVVSFSQDRVLDKEQEELLSKINYEDGSCDDEIYTRVVQRLLFEGQLEQALSVADNMLSEGAPDDLLQALVEKTKDKSIVWQYIRRIRDTESVAALTLKWCHMWDAEIGNDLLYMCECHLDPESDIYKRIDMQTKRLQTCHNIVEEDPSHWDKWQAVAEAAEKDPALVVGRLVEIQRYQLAREVVEQRDAPHLRAQIEEMYLIDLLTKTRELGRALEVLMSLGEEALPICNSLLAFLKFDYANQLFLVQFLLNKLRSLLSDDQFSTMLVRELGLQCMIRLPTCLQPLYHELVSNPALMVENLLMEQHTSLVGRLFRELPELQDDELAIAYAEKALAFPEDSSIGNSSAVNEEAGQLVLDTSEKQDAGERNGTGPSICNHADVPFLVRSNHWLDGNEKHDMEVRMKHVFGQAPSFTLAKSFLDLCADSTGAGTACLRICDSLSQLLVTGGGKEGRAEDRQIAARIIHKMLHYARACFLKDADGYSRVMLCDTFIIRATLMQSLLSAYCKFPTPMSDLSDASKSRQLRDRLIDVGRMSLAIEVCDKCQIEPESVWYAWGLSLLHMGLYDEAKRKLEHCFANINRGNSVFSRGQVLSDTRVLEIVNVLEAGPPVQYQNLKRVYEDLAKRGTRFTDDFTGETYIDSLRTPIIFSAARQPRKNSYLDAEQLAQCLYYLEEYASVGVLVGFYTRHNMLEDACRYVFGHDAPNSVFIEQIVRPVVRKGEFSRLRDVLLKIDPTLKTIESYLVATCESMSKAHDILYELALIMREEWLAGVTCIKLFVNSLPVSSFSMQMRHLENAKTHLTEALVQVNDPHFRTKLSNITEAQPPKTQDISQLLRQVQLQMEVCTYFQQIGDAVNGAGGGGSATRATLHLFLRPKKAELVEMIMPNNFDLAWRIMYDSRMGAAKHFKNVALRMARAKDHRLSELLQNMKSRNINDRDYDSVVIEIVELYVNEFEDLKGAERFIGGMSDVHLKVRACIACRKHKTAYKYASQANSVNDIRLLRNESIKIQSKQLLNLCDRYLSTHGHMVS